MVQGSAKDYIVARCGAKAFSKLKSSGEFEEDAGFCNRSDVLAEHLLPVRQVSRKFGGRKFSLGCGSSSYVVVDAVVVVIVGAEKHLGTTPG